MRGVEQIPWLYDAMFTVFEATGLGRWRDWLVEGARGRVLEIGCGTGRNLPRYRGVTSLVGVDLSPDALRRAHHRAPGVGLVCGSAEALPFPDASFDTVVSSLVFCSVNHVPAGLAEIRRVLAPGGELRMLEHVRSEHRVGAWMQDRLQPAWTWAAGGCRPNRETERAVREAGFEILPESRRAQGTMRRFVARAH